MLLVRNVRVSFMRAVTVEPAGHVAVVAENSNPFREPVLDQPFVVHAGSCVGIEHLSPVYPAATCGMVNAEEFDPGLATASALSPVMLKDCQADPAASLSVVLLSRLSERTMNWEASCT